MAKILMTEIVLNIWKLENSDLFRISDFEFKNMRPYACYLRESAFKIKYMTEDLLFNNKIAVAGDEDVVIGFAALGFSIYPLKTPEDFKSVVDKLIEENIAICLVQNDAYNANIEKINSYRQLSLPIFVPFSKDAERILLDDILKDIRLKATGAL